MAFWDPRSGTLYTKQLPSIRFLLSSPGCEYCVTAYVEKEEPKSSAPQKSDIVRSMTLQVRNAIGAVVDTKSLPFHPKSMTMSYNYIFAADDRTVYAFNFQQSSSSSAAEDAQVAGWKGKERMMDIDNVAIAIPQPAETYRIISDPVDNPIRCMCAGEKYLLVARQDGSIIRFLLPYLNVENTFNAACEPFRMEMNCTATKVAVIDINGVLSVLDMTALSDTREDGKDSAMEPAYGKKLSIDRRDVWDFKWARDDDNMLAVMEKTKMAIIVGETADEPSVSSAYLARFGDLEVTGVSLDELFANPEQPSADLVVSLETKLLRDTKDVVSVNGLGLGYSFVEKNAHPRLWKLLAELALEDLDLGVAEKCFVRSHDYFGLQLVKQLRSMPDKMKRRAEVELYMGRYDEAETIYREIDRKDLAVQMRKKLGDYSRVVQLLRGDGGGSTDDEIREALDDIGNTLCDAFKWKKAVQYFSDSGNVEKLVECHCRLNNYDELRQLCAELSENNPLLATAAAWFESVGMHKEAVDCYLRFGNPKAAIDCCVSLNRWGDALELAEKHNFSQVEGLFLRLAGNMVSQGPLKQLEAVELYRCANKPQEAALLIGDIAERVAREDDRPLLAKKLHVLAALEIERHRKLTSDSAVANNLGTSNGVAKNTAATLDTLMMTSLDTKGGGSARRAATAFGSAWRGAAAYHYFMLAQSQLQRGNYDAAMKTAIRCCEYEDVLGAKDVYSVLGLAAYKNGYFDTSSKAFVKVSL